MVVSTTPTEPQPSAIRWRGYGIPAITTVALQFSGRSRLNTIDYLRRTPAGEDLFFFYTALASRMGLEISSRKLTEYRIHDLGSSVPGARRGQGALAPLLQAESEKRARNLKVIRSMLLDAGQRDLVPWIQREIANLNLLQGIPSLRPSIALNWGLDSHAGCSRSYF